MGQPDTFTDELERVSAELDQVIADRRNGRPSQTRSDGQIDQVERLGMRLLSAARGPGRPVNPPIGRTPAGGYIW